MPILKNKGILIDVSPKSSQGTAFVIFQGQREDVTILKTNAHSVEVMINRTKQVKVVSASLVNNALIHDVRTRFGFYRNLCDDIAAGKVRAAFIHGKGGISKSVTIEQAIERARNKNPEKEIIVISGSITKPALFNLLCAHPEATIIFDDANDVVKDKGCVDILLPAMESGAHKPRIISYLTVNGIKKVEFKGNIAIITNLSRSEINAALLTRCTVISLEMTVDETVELMKSMLMDITTQNEISPEDRKFVMNRVEILKDVCKIFNLRVLTNALETYAINKDVVMLDYIISQN